MKVWINEYIKKVSLIKQNFERDGQQCALLSITFKDGSNVNIYLTGTDLTLLTKEMPEF